MSAVIGIAAPVLTDDDGVGNDVFGMAEALAGLGHRVVLYAGRHDTPRPVRRLTPAAAGDPLDLLVYHHATGCPEMSAVFAAAGYKKVLKYHNITPPEYFAPGSPEYVSCTLGVRQTADLLAGADAVWADSGFNRDELAVLRHETAAAVLPPFHRTEELLLAPPDRAFSGSGEGVPLFAVVGRVVPNKGAVTAVAALAEYRRRYGPARLLVVGDDAHPYAAEVRAAADGLGVGADVTLTGKVSRPQLAAVYRAAAVLLVPSRHEGFCVPLVEALAFGLPAVCRPGTALTETGAGVARFCDGGPGEWADAMRAAVGRPDPAGAAKYRAEYHPDVIRDRFLAAVDEVLAAPRARAAAAGPGVNVIGYLSSEKGIGEAARGLVRAARAVGVPAAVNDIVDPGSANVARERPAGRTGLPFGVNVLAVNPDTLPHFALYADLRRLRRGRYTVGYWFWELAELPPTWIEWFAAVDEVWVGSSFIQDAVSRAAPCPVVCVPPALAPDPPRAAVSRAVLGLPADAYVFLFLFDAASTLGRKNPVGLVRAFRAAFPAEPDVRLVVKTSRLGTAPDRDLLLREAAGDGRVVLLGGELPRPAVTGLIALADCYASLHRAEGVGLTLAEAMLLGKPVIGTAYSGNLDFMTPRNSLLVDARPVRLDRDHGPYPAGATWADPDLGHAAELMRWAYRNRDAAAQLGRRAREDAAAKFDPRGVGERIAQRLAAIQRGRGTPPPPPDGWELKPLPDWAVGGTAVAEVGSPGTCGVAVYAPAVDAPPVRVVGRWTTYRGDPFPDAPPVSVPVRVAADGQLPVAYVRVPFSAPDGLGDFVLELDLADAAGRPVPAAGGPARVPVHVTGRRADAIDYPAVYAAADLARDHWTVVGPRTREEYARLSRVKLDLLVRLGLTPHSRLLDVGCGTGLLAAAAEGYLADDGAYHGTDVAEPAVRFCRDRYRRPNFSFDRNDPTRLGVAGRRFDAIAFYSVFTHTLPEETAALLRDAAALLAPGGFVLADLFVSPLVKAHAGHRGAVEVNPDRLRELVAAAPLAAEEVLAEPWGRYARRVFLRLTKP